jgi:hypothetical protein
MEALNMAFKKGDFSTYFKRQEVLNAVCTSTGILKEKIIRETQPLAALHASTGNAGKVLELGQRLHQECLHKYWMLAYQTGRILSLCHLQLANLDESQGLALEIFELSSRECLTCESQAEFHLAHVRSARARVGGSASIPEKLRGVVDWLLATIPDMSHLDTNP